MNRYPPSRHHPAFAVVALALTALTIALTVILPANSVPAGRMPAVMAGEPYPTEVVISPARIDVVAVREAKVADGEVRVAPAKGGRPG